MFDIRKVFPFLILFLCMAILASTSAMADSTDNKGGFNRISLKAESSIEVENDLMQAQLAVEGEGIDPARLADQINRNMQWALKIAHESRSIDIKSGGYHTQPVYRKDSPYQWRASQMLSLESSNSAALSNLIGKLQEKLQVKSMRFMVSPEKRRATENNLIEKALDAFKARAEIVRSNLKANGYQIVNISINIPADRHRPVPVMRGISSTMKVAEPAVDTGTSSIVVSVSGTIQLRN